MIVDIEITSGMLGTDSSLEGGTINIEMVIGVKSDQGDDYILTNQDKTDIATEAAGMVDLSNYPTKDEIPDVPDWALSATKPTYSASEVGALPDTTVVIPEAPQDGNYYSRINDQWVLTGYSDATGTYVPLAFVEHWNTIVGSYGTYNVDTGYFEYFSLLDLTYDDAREVICTANLMYGSQEWGNSSKARINIMPATEGANGISVSLAGILSGATNLEVAVLTPSLTHIYAFLRSINRGFRYCTKLHTVIGRISGTSSILWTSGAVTFGECPALKSVYITGYAISFSLADSPLILPECIIYLIENSAATTTVTLTLHSTAAENARTAYLEAPEEGYDTLDLWAASKNISIATA